MAFGDPYLQVSEFKARSRSTSAANDEAIEAVLLSASRQIDGFCGREFNQSDGDEYRFFDDWHCRGRWRHVVPFANDYWQGPDGSIEVGDVVSVTEIAGDDGSGAYPLVWDPDSYQLLPLTAGVKRRPYAAIGRTRAGSWPLTSYPIRVAGVWGWPAVPPVIKEATYLIANRLKSLFDAPFGQSGGGEMGSLDMTGSITPIIRDMIAPYRVMPV
jgi:hypothetical protein